MFNPHHRLVVVIKNEVTVAIEIIQPPSGKFCVFVSEKKDTISDTILKHYSFLSFLQSNNLFSDCKSDATFKP